MDPNPGGKFGDVNADMFTYAYTSTQTHTLTDKPRKS